MRGSDDAAERSPAGGGASATARSVRGFLDAPRSGEIIDRSGVAGRGILEVLGWAADGAGSVAVEIEIDGLAVDRARIGLPRPDVAAALDDPALSFAGWQSFLDLRRLAAGRRALEIHAVALARDGERVLIGTAAIVLADAAPPDDLRVEAPGPSSAWRARRRRVGRRPKILAIIQNLDRGGSQLILLERLRDLVSTGEVEAAVVSPFDGPLRSEFERLGIPCHLAGLLVPPDAGLYQEKLDELAQWGGPQAFDLVVASTLGAAPGIDLARTLGLPSVWLIYERTVAKHHLSPFVSLQWPTYAVGRVYDALRHCPAIVFDSQACRRDYLAHADPARLMTIPGAIDLEAIDRFRAGFDREAERRVRGIPADARLVLGLGSVVALKGASLLLQVFCRLAVEQPDLSLALVGSRPDAFAAAMPAFAASRGLQERVRVEPMGADAYAWLGMADLMVSASYRESMPRVVLEAMAFEVPVVSTAEGDVPEVLRDGVSGWLCPSRDPVVLEQVLRRALSATPAERSLIVATAAQSVRTDRDARQAGAAFRALLRRMLEAPPG